MLDKLMRHHAGERGGWSVVRVPSIEEEDARRLHRELERLKRERLAHRVRMQSLLVIHGMRVKIKSTLRLGSLTLWDGRPLPAEPKAELEREVERLRLVERQIAALEAERRERLREPKTEAQAQHRAVDALGGDRAHERLAAGDGVLSAGGAFATGVKWRLLRAW